MGNDIFTKAITTADGQVTFTLPEDGEWIDYWTGEEYQGGQQLTKTYSLSQFPLFIRAGAIIPLQRDKRTFVVYPKDKSNRKFHLPKGDGIDYFDCTISYDVVSGHLKMASEMADDYVFIIGQQTIPFSGSSADFVIR